MPKWTQNISINTLYIIGVVSVAGLIILNQVITQLLIHERETDALVVNVAGKQRMLSQKMAFYTYRVAEEEALMDSLHQLSDEFLANHRMLLQGDEEQGFPKVEVAYIEASLNELTPLVEQLHSLITDADNQAALLENNSQIVANAETFLPKMDHVVESFQRESEEDIKRLAIIEIGVAFLSILILLLEVWLVFKPIIKEIEIKTRKLQKAILSRDRILATIVHDLRNPINGIKGLNNLLKEDLEQYLSDDQDLMFNLINDSSDKANALIEELLEISVLDNDEFELETKSVRLGEYIMGNIYQFKKRAKEKGVELNLSTQGKDLLVQIDPKRFARVIDNLISNALKFTNAEGEVKIELKEDGNSNMIVISDTGIGIPENMQPYIFDKFSRARRSGLDGEQATGLGMSIVKQIVQLHKGDIWLESEENKGTKFYISLPKAS